MISILSKEQKQKTTWTILWRYKATHFSHSTCCISCFWHILPMFPKSLHFIPEGADTWFGTFFVVPAVWPLVVLLFVLLFVTCKDEAYFGFNVLMDCTSSLFYIMIIKSSTNIIVFCLLLLALVFVVATTFYCW